MQRFEEIIELAAERQGGSEALRKSLAETQPLAPADIAAVPDHQMLASAAVLVQQGMTVGKPGPAGRRTITKLCQTARRVI